MVDGEIQTILHCIFGKFSFPTNGLAMNENDAKIDNCSLIYFPVLSPLSELSSPLLLNSLCILLKFFYYYFTLVLAHHFSHWSSNNKDLV